MYLVDTYIFHRMVVLVYTHVFGRVFIHPLTHLLHLYIPIFFALS